MIPSEAPFFNTHSSIASPDVMIEDADKKSRTWRGFMPGCSRPNSGDRFFLLNKTKQNKTKMKNEAQTVRERATRRGGSWGSHHPHRTTTTTRCARRRHPSPARTRAAGASGLTASRCRIKSTCVGVAVRMRAWLLRQVTKRQRRRGHMLRSPDTHARPPSAPLN